MSPPNLLAATTTVGRVLLSQQLPTIETAIYTVDANQMVTVKSGVLCNTSGAPVTVSLSVVPTGATIDGTHRVISGFALGAGDSLDLRGYLTGTLLGDGDYVAASASASSSVTLVLTGLVSAA